MVFPACSQNSLIQVIFLHMALVELVEVIWYQLEDGGTDLVVVFGKPCGFLVPHIRIDRFYVKWPEVSTFWSYIFSKKSNLLNSN